MPGKGQNQSRLKIQTIYVKYHFIDQLRVSLTKEWRVARPPKSVEHIQQLKRFFFLTRQNPFFLGNYPSLAHLISRT